MERLHFRRCIRLAFKYRFAHLGPVNALTRSPHQGMPAMLIRSERLERLASIADRVRSATHATTSLVSAIASEISHDDVNGSMSPSATLGRLIAVSAWTDTAMALLASELPQWKLRRLAYDDGEWHCTLSRQREFPEWLDDGIETHNEDLALAIFNGLIEAARREPVRTPPPTTPRIRIKQRDSICCDNFA